MILIKEAKSIRPFLPVHNMKFTDVMIAGVNFHSNLMEDMMLIQYNETCVFSTG